LTCKSELIGRFKIANYGKAPAFITNLRASIFPSPGPFNTDAFPIKPLPGTIKRFPEPDEFLAFVRKWGKAAHINIDESQDFPLKPEGPEPSREYFVSTEIDPEIPVPPSGKTSLLFFRGADKLKSFVTGIPIEQATEIFFVGELIYSMPDDRFEVIRFCYQANRHGGFSPIFGAPYNERKKTPQTGSDGSASDNTAI
jgi:hypothetical protein